MHERMVGQFLLSLRKQKTRRPDSRVFVRPTDGVILNKSYNKKIKCKKLTLANNCERTLAKQANVPVVSTTPG